MTFLSKKRGVYHLYGSKGFTMIEVLMVILLLGTLSLAVVGRMNNGTIDLITTADKLTSHIRLVQTIAMNQSPGIWGIRFETGSQSYYMFHCADPDNCDMTDENTTYAVPGSDTFDGDQKRTRISTENKVRITADTNVAYDRFGIPYQVSSGQANDTQNTITLSLTDSSGNNHAISIEPKTGFIR